MTDTDDFIKEMKNKHYGFSDTSTLGDSFKFDTRKKQRDEKHDDKEYTNINFIDFDEENKLEKSNKPKTSGIVYVGTDSSDIGNTFGSKPAKPKMTDSSNLGGGLFGTDSTELFAGLLLDAFKTRKINEVVFLLQQAKEKKIKLCLRRRDESGKSILHYLVIYCGFDITVRDTLLEVLNYHNISEFVNNQDNTKNTPSHYALSLNHLDILQMLIAKGADLSIKNDKGFYIKEDVEKEVTPNEDARNIVNSAKESEVESIFTKISSDQYVGSNKDTKKISNEQYVSTEQYVPIHADGKKVKLPSFHMDESETINFSRNDTDKSDFMKVFLEKKGHLPQMSAEQPREVPSLGGNHSILTDPDVDTAEILERIIRKQKGGRKLVVTGTRHIPALSETGGASEEGDAKEQLRKMHFELLKKIKHLLNTDKQTAFRYKKVIYRKMREENPELSTKERYEELDKMLTKDLLDSINLEEDERKLNIEQSGGAFDGSDSSDSSNVAGRVMNKAKQIHIDTVNKIMGLLGVDLDSARRYKRIIYYHVKEERPELNNFDRAVEMQKRATREYLENINVEQEEKDLEKKGITRPVFEKPKEDEEPKKVKKTKKSSKTTKDTKVTKAKKSSKVTKKSSKGK